MIAEVIIDSAAKQLNRTFDYNIPKELEEFISIGSTVLVPFGKMKKLEEAYVVGLKTTTEYEVKSIVKLKDNLTETQIRLAKWMSRKYFCNVSECIKLMLAPGTKSKNKVQEKKVNAVYLKKSIEEIKEDIKQGKIKSQKHKRVLQFLEENEGAISSDIEMLADCTHSVLKTLEKNGYIKFVEKKIERNPLKNKQVVKTKKLNLTSEQLQAFETIKPYINEEKYKKFLLFGVTGSGKTEVYLQLIEETIKKGKTAIMLVPEISLTPQTIERFIGRFGKEKIAILHSKLSFGERFDEWNKIKDGNANIIIGARSAIFAPTDNIGIIIIDEEHDSSYKSESMPRYNAKEIADILGKQKNFPIVLGSATPDINTYYKTSKQDGIILTLNKRANSAKLPKIEIVDLKKELANGNRSMLSHSLYQAIEKNLKDKRQTILFLNRRGYSTFIMCRECGYTVKCKNCNISMTYHKTENKLKCHYCGFEQSVLKICPNCKSDKIRYFGTGTQKLEQEINKLFPNAKTIRMDVDTVTKKNSHEDILNHFKNDGIDILIGTQMVVKGHHFPNVTLVGVVAADASLNIDDYRANERTFQILTQVAGRAGRENLEGRVIIQTYNPENFSIELAKKQNYIEFYKTEIALRKQLKYPPFCDIIVINFSSEKEAELKKASSFIYNFLNQKLDKQKYFIFKPLPSPIDKIQRKIRWRMIIKGNMTKQIYDTINEALKETYNLNLKYTGIYADVNPNSMI